MSELSGQCEDDACLKECSSLSIRVFPCLYHCKKMLCIRHLSEHDKCTEKQIQSKKQLENLWNSYILIFNEDKAQEKFQNLKMKLETFQKLRKDIQNVLSINNFHDSMENNRKLQIAIETVEKFMEQENQSKSTINDTEPKGELITDDYEENQQTIDYESLSLSVITNNDSETVDFCPSVLNTNGNSPLTEPDNEYFQDIAESDDYGNSMEFENEDNTIEASTLEDQINITPKRNMPASKFRGYCPLTQDGAFGISCQLHGIRLCPKINGNLRTFRLHEHFRRVHHLTPLASLTLARAIRSGLNPMTTQLFDDNHIILNIDELRTVACPINKGFINYPTLHILNSPCDTIKQVRQLRDHLKRVHKFTSKATNIIIKAVKTDTPIHMIQFPRWIDIIEDE
ncbi:unnamed protein product [Rotaria socialis]